MITYWVELAATGIEILAVAIIVSVITMATAAYAFNLLTGKPTRGGLTYKSYRLRIARSLLLGLEILVAADIIRTVALQPSLQNVVILALLVLIRTFLSWSLVVETEGRWPWQAAGHAEEDA